MAEFRGYRCDRCERIVEKADLTRLTTRYVGSHANGEYDEDLCPTCTSESLENAPELRPLRRRAAGSKEPVGV